MVRDGEVAARYHELTKHSPETVRGAEGRLLLPSGFRPMDGSNQPNPFKSYEGAEQLPLSAAGSLARLLRLGAGIKTAGRLRNRFRTYASAGALYPVEVYAVTSEIDGLEPGVYHFAPDKDALVTLRQGDHRDALVRASAAEPSTETAALTLIFTGVPWRTTWKYTQRGYRHLFWDAGMILANFLALLSSEETKGRVIVGFVDEEVEKLIDVDGTGEFPLCLLTIDGSPTPVGPTTSAPDPINVPSPALSRREFRFPEIDEVNDAGRLADPAEVTSWRSGPNGSGSPPDPEPSDLDEKAIRRRGSARYFGDRPMPREVLEDILRRAHRGIPTDYAPAGSHLIESFLIANNVDGVERGSYRWSEHELVLLKRGDLRREAGYLCLEQPLGATSAATIFLMTDLDTVLRSYGARGYRAAQLESGIVGGKMYISAYGQRFGATGLTFYDDEVSTFFSPEAADKSCMLVVAVGDSPRLRGPNMET
jgi:SagB-type dehydrogenase family enzyme